MINTASLSLQQAPPISVPLRFFLTAPLFSIAAAVQLFLYGDQILASRWLPVTLSFTHLITLGYLAMIMCGAMLQMLPVMAGTPVERVEAVGASAHLLISLGTVVLAAGFLGWGWLPVAVLLLLAGFSVIVFAVGRALWRRRDLAVSTPVKNLRLATLALALTVALGLTAVLSFVGLLPSRSLLLITHMHVAWGVAGWVGLLLVSVAFQLVPMFNVTPEYPQWMKMQLPRLIFLLLVVWCISRVIGYLWSRDVPAMPVLLAICSAYLLFAFATLKLQFRRKRKVPDVTLSFWQTGLVSLIVCAVLWMAGLWYSPLALWPGYETLLGLGLLIGFAVSIINGMLYKIVPFLSWFHLQNRQLALMKLAVTIPHMKAFISDRAARVQFLLHLAALLSLAAVAGGADGMLLRPAALLFFASNMLLGANLWVAVWRYRRHLRLLSSGG